MGVTLLLIIYMALLLSSIFMLARKVKGAVFLMVFWVVLITSNVFYNIDSLNGFLKITLYNEIASSIASVAAAYTIFLWLFNIQRIKKVDGTKDLMTEDKP